MRVSVVAGLIVAVHVAVIGSVVMTQGCASTQGGAASTTPTPVETAPVPPMPPSTTVTAVPAPVAQPVPFPTIQPPAPPAPMKTSVAAENVYVVKAGDSLSKIAAVHGVKAAELKELNQITDANKIRVGQKLILPDYAKPSQSQPAAKSAAAPAKASAATAAGGDYVVKAGDALSKIATAHGVKLKELMAANNITDANKIRVGQKLVIPGVKAAEKTEKKEAPAAKPEKKADAPAVAAPAAAPADPAPAPAVAVPAAAPAPEAAPAMAAPAPSQDAMLDYTVQEGDTAEGIARLFVVSKDDILKVNNIPAGSDVKPGKTIKIPPSSM